MPSSSAATRTRAIARSLSDSGSADADDARAAAADPATRIAAPPLAPLVKNSALLNSTVTSAPLRMCDGRLPRAIGRLGPHVSYRSVPPDQRERIRVQARIVPM